MLAPGLLLQAAPTGAAALLSSPLVPAAVAVVFGYLLLYRPMAKQRQELESMRSKLQAGDEVLTTGGLFGKVTRMKDDRVHVRVASGVEVEFAKGAIASVIPPKERE